MYLRFIVILFLSYSFSIVAQQSAQYSQYTFNNFGYNPAFLGTVKCIDLKAGTRMQWVGFNGAPRTSFFSIQWSNPKNFKKRKGRHSLGGYVEQDNVHLTTRTFVKLAYSYHTRLNARYRMGLGLFGGIQQYTTNTSFGGENNDDPVLASISGSVLHYPDLMPGLLLYTKSSYWSFSVNQLYFKKIKLGQEQTQVNQYYIGWGHKSANKSNWSLLKSFLIRYNIQGPPSMDLNIAWTYMQKTTLGLGYRIGEAAMAQLKFNLGRLVIGYGFDYPLNRLRGNYGHEIMIGFNRCDSGDDGLTAKKPKVCPAYGK